MMLILVVALLLVGSLVDVALVRGDVGIEFEVQQSPANAGVVPEPCARPARAGDHLMLEFDLIAPNGTSYAKVMLPSQLRHAVLGEPVSTYLFFEALLLTIELFDRMKSPYMVP
jgi:hypothetical protein